MPIRDRIEELRRVPASELRPNPRNWRTHPATQRHALRALLTEIGYADALLARRLEDGALELVDGHLRAETTPDAVVPVLVLDLDQNEADKLLLTLDPLAGMAEAASESLQELLGAADIDSDAVRPLLESLVDKYGPAPGFEPPRDAEPSLPECYQVVVECHDESEQRDVYERLHAEGLACRLLTL